MSKATEVKKRGEALLENGIANMEQYREAVPLIFALNEAAAGARAFAKALSDNAAELSDLAAAYAIDHKTALDEPLAEAKDGIKSGVALIGDTKYRLTISQGAPKRISGGTLTQGFLSELPKAWTKQKLALHVTGMKNATAEELAEHDLQRETVRAWSLCDGARG